MIEIFLNLLDKNILLLISKEFNTQGFKLNELKNNILKSNISLDKIIYFLKNKNINFKKNKKLILFIIENYNNKTKENYNKLYNLLFKDENILTMNINKLEFQLNILEKEKEKLNKLTKKHTVSLEMFQKKLLENQIKIQYLVEKQNDIHIKYEYLEIQNMENYDNIKQKIIYKIDTKQNLTEIEINTIKLIFTTKNKSYLLKQYFNKEKIVNNINELTIFNKNLFDKINTEQKNKLNYEYDIKKINELINAFKTKLNDLITHQHNIINYKHQF